MTEWCTTRSIAAAVAMGLAKMRSHSEKTRFDVMPKDRRSNRKAPAGYDRHLYRERHLVECFINKIKHYRRIFSRFEKLDTRYLGFLHFTAALIWLR